MDPPPFGERHYVHGLFWFTRCSLLTRRRRDQPATRFDVGHGGQGTAMAAGGGAVLGLAQVNFDNAQLELGGAYTSLAPAPTLLAGDWLQLGSGLGTSQLVKVVADAQAGTNSRMTVQVEPPLRIQFASTTAVTWDRPLAYYKQIGAPQWSYRPGMVAKQGGFALDLLEAFA